MMNPIQQFLASFDPTTQEAGARLVDALRAIVGRLRDREPAAGGACLLYGTQAPAILLAPGGDEARARVAMRDLITMPPRGPTALPRDFVAHNDVAFAAGPRPGEVRSPGGPRTYSRAQALNAVAWIATIARLSPEEITLARCAVEDDR